MTARLAVDIWLMVAVVLNGIVAVELAGILDDGPFRTISWTARRKWYVRLLVGFIFLTGAVWWWFHSSSGCSAVWLGC